MAARKSASAARAPRTSKAAPLPVPAPIEQAWALVKNRAMRQLFHPDPARRLAAVKVMTEKFRPHAERGHVLLGAALAEPDAQVKAAMLAAVAPAADHLGWQDVRRLKAALPALSQAAPAVRRELALCARSIPLSLDASDVPWIETTLGEQAAGEGSDDTYQQALLLLLNRMAARDVPGALEALVRVARQPRLAIAIFLGTRRLGDRKAALDPVALEHLQAGGETAYWAARHLGFQGPSASTPAALAAVAAHTRTDPKHADGYRLIGGLLDPTTLPPILVEYEARIAATNTDQPLHHELMEALGWSPSQAAPHIEKWGAYNLTDPHLTDAGKQRWLAGNRDLMLRAIEARLSDVALGPGLARWWMDARPGDGQSALLAAMNAALAAHPQGYIPYEQQRLIKAFCVELERRPWRSAELVARLASNATRMATSLVSSMLPSVRAMHACGASEADFVPLLAVFESEARRAESRGKRAWAARARATGRLMPALGSIDRVKQQWADVETLWNDDFPITNGDVVDMLAPFVADAQVRALLEQGTHHRHAAVQRACAIRLGLLEARS